MGYLEPLHLNKAAKTMVSLDCLGSLYGLCGKIAHEPWSW